MKDYFVGFDMGTDSLGWAATDENYNILKNHGKALWGVHLFDEGQTAEERRGFRAARRRTERKHQRLMLLRELFSEEMFKVDKNFFDNLDESKYFLDDKKSNEKYTIFNDDNYTDIQYHKDYPTIYHLRSALINNDKKYDIRLVYLAIANIIKHRGHFLFDGLSAEETKEFEPVYNDLINTLSDYGIEFVCSDSDNFQKILKDKSIGITEKKKRLYSVCGELSHQGKTICDILAGGKVTFKNLFDDESLKDCEEKSVTFKSGYDDKESVYADILGDRMYLLEKLKAVYDWAILAEILSGEKYISDAQVNQYNKHKKDLKLLKALFVKYANESYSTFFNSPDEKANYCTYVGKTSKKKEVLKEKLCSQEDMCKYALKLLGTIEPENDDEKYILNELKLFSALPKQITKSNNVIPNQLHSVELKCILNNASKYYGFLNYVSDEKSVKEKVEMLLSFRIPYYVGPLNQHSKNAWIVRKDSGKIYPWNFDEKVDKEKSAVNFIERMTNFCTYLVGEKVLPKCSVVFSKYCIYNQLNNIRVNGNKLPPEVKNRMFEDKYLNVGRAQKMTINGIIKYLKTIGYCSKIDSIEITGIDKEIVGTMKSYIDFKNILGDMSGKEEMVENIISEITVLSESKSLLKEFINKEYGNELTVEQINNMTKLKYNDWGSLSAKFLTGIFAVDKSSGEYFNIMTALENTDCNLMQLLSSDYSFKDEIDKFNEELNNVHAKLSYDIVEKTYTSPAVKRSIWRTLLVANEITKAEGRAPTKFFIEMARGATEAQKNNRTVSRKGQLEYLYKSCIKDYPGIYESLMKTDENRLRSDKLFLYYLQFGKCAYSGDPIDLEDINDKNKYDIDHIYPRSKTKDNSLDNRVLVKGTLNKEKEDKFPLPLSFKTAKTKALWDKMKAVGTMSSEKYYRLTRTTPLTADELAGFISRQIVETRQSTKAVAEILKQLYPDSEIVYVKAGNVSDFRDNDKVKLLKSRSINDYHHAKDAYLNIVVGNVYNMKFTRSPVNFIKDAQVYSLNRMYDFDVKRGGKTAWIAENGESLKTVKHYMAKNNILFTRYATEQKGGFFNQMPLKAGKGQMPLKTSDKRLHDISRYGGYNSVSSAYYVLVRHTVKGKRVKTIEYIPVYLAKKIEADSSVLDKYIAEQFEEPEILIRKIKINTLFDVDGFKMHLSSRTGNKLVFKGANQLVVSEKQYMYFKRIDKYIDRNKKLKTVQTITDFQKITKEENLEIYDVFTEKLKNTVYNKRLSAQVNNFVSGRETFTELSVEQQCVLLSEAVKLFHCNVLSADLTLINGSGRSGIITLDSDITKLKNIKIINQSVTGLFENSIDLAKL